MELLSFGHAGAGVLVFPTREGRFFDYEGWGEVGVLSETIEAGNIRLYCVDGFDSESLYCRGIAPSQRARRYRDYEAYILEEVIPLTRSDLPENPEAPLIAHGCSIGAWHSVSLAFRHPWLFRKVVALSGRYDLTEACGPFEDLFSGYYDEDIYYINPNHFVPNLTDPAYLEPMRRMEITLAIGRDDPFYESNVRLSVALREKGVQHRLDIWPGEAHKARYWRQMSPLYL